MSPGHKWPFFQPSNKERSPQQHYTKNSAQPALKGANSHHKFPIVLLLQKGPDSSQMSAAPALYPNMGR